MFRVSLQDLDHFLQQIRRFWRIEPKRLGQICPHDVTTFAPFFVGVANFLQAIILLESLVLPRQKERLALLIFHPFRFHFGWKLKFWSNIFNPLFRTYLSTCFSHGFSDKSCSIEVLLASPSPGGFVLILQCLFTFFSWRAPFWRNFSFKTTTKYVRREFLPRAFQQRLTLFQGFDT